MRYSEIINEVSYKDLYSNKFEKFRKKYSKKVRKKYYVQFTQTDNTMDRTSFLNPDHSDPVGIYGYPLKYVIDYPADIWYGAGARFLRVLELVSNRILDLQSIKNINDVHSLWAKLGFDIKSFNELEYNIKNNFKDRIGGNSKFAKIFFQGLQYNFENNSVRSSQEQAQLLLKAGFNVMVDRARSEKSAVINDREPEQLVFLDRSAFRVIEVFNLRGNIKADKLPGMTNPDPNAEVIARSLVAKIAHAIGDNVGSGPLTYMGGNMYWTNSGDRISVKMNYTTDYMNNNIIGKKIHKANRDFFPKDISVIVTGSKGTIEKVYDPGTRFDFIANDIGEKWESQSVNNSWEPETMKSYLKKREDKNKQKREEERNQQENNFKKDTDKLVTSAKEINEKLGIDFKLEEQNATIFALWLDRFSNMLKINNNPVPINEKIDGAIKSATRLTKRKITDDEQSDILDNNIDALRKLWDSVLYPDSYYATGRNMIFYINSSGLK